MNALTAHSQGANHRVSILRWCSLFCLLAGGILLTWCAYFWADGHFYETLETKHFDAVAKSAVVNPAPGAEINVVEPPPRVETGSVLGRIEIPRVGISVMVLQGTTARVFRRAAGHLEGTAVPGKPGNVAIAAHRDTFFRPLRNIRDQDVIKFSGVTRSYWYRVESVEVVGPDDVEVLADSTQPTLTLITCYPFYYVGPAPKRFIVHARQISPEEAGEVQGSDGSAQLLQDGPQTTKKPE